MKINYKCRAEINKMKIKGQLKKSKDFYFEKINKFNKALVKPTDRNRRSKLIKVEMKGKRLQQILMKSDH